MSSTWRHAKRDEWTLHHWLIEVLDLHPSSLNEAVPVHSKEEKIPHIPQWPQHLWVIFYASVPLVIHQAWLSYNRGQGLGNFAVFNLYFVAFNAAIIREIQMIRRLGNRYGFLDGDAHERDGIPDVGVVKVVRSLYKTTGSRLFLAVILSYNADISPVAAMSHWQWWPLLLLEVGLYSIVLDFWFYWYHRAMHDVGFLWKFHRTHHLTKHPNPLLTAYADHEQEFFDMVGVPVMTYFTFKAAGLPLGFYEWWICHQYVAFTEVFGHSGLRLHLTPPTTFSWLLKMFHVEIVIEDHDLHHRKGWRKSHNYGKQSRLWDRIFGTCLDRIESEEANVDYENPARMPIF